MGNRKNIKSYLKNSSLEFYNNFDTKLINDYVLGNKRIESAIVNLGTFIPASANNILDIGCGLGWSTHEFSKKFKKSNILGIDLSSVLIDKAKRLFVNDNLNYEIFDVTKDVLNIKFDAIILIDVYEHILKEERFYFHKFLKNIMNDNARIILACPSKFHQSWLRKNNPSGLQPVDEDVDFETIQDFSKDINGEVVFFEYKKIWDNLDYFYSVIDINPIYGNESTIRSIDKITLEDKKSRRLRIQEKLNISIDIPKDDNIKISRVIKKYVRKVLTKIK